VIEVVLGSVLFLLYSCLELKAFAICNLLCMLVGLYVIFSLSFFHGEEADYLFVKAFARGSFSSS